MNSNLWLSKYKPKSFDSFMLNKSISKKCKNLAYNQLYINTILHGVNGVGKYTIAMCILEELFGNGVYNKHNTRFTLKNGKNIEILSSNYHYEIYCNSYIFNDKKLIIDIIEHIADTPNIALIDNHSIKYNIILLRNFQYVPSDIIYGIKTISEKKYMNCKFLLITNNIVSITHIISNFVSLRVPIEKSENILSYIKYILNNENINYENNYDNDSILMGIIKENNHNLSKIISILEASFITGKYKKYHNEYDSIINKIIKTIEEKRASNFTKIRDYIYDITTKNIDKNDIFKDILRYFINSKNYNNNTKNEIISICAKYQWRFKISYKEIVHIEAFLINIMRIINNQ